MYVYVYYVTHVSELVFTENSNNKLSSKGISMICTRYVHDNIAPRIVHDLPILQYNANSTWEYVGTYYCP